MTNPHTSVGQRHEPMPADSLLAAPAPGWLQLAIGLVLVLEGVAGLIAALAKGGGR